MPNDTSGFTGNEIVSRVQNYIGNFTSKFKTYVEQTLPLAEFRFCKLHDWKFLQKSGLSLTLVNGTSEYDLSVANIGFFMAAENVWTIRIESEGTLLKKVTLADIRRFDPANDDGSSDDNPAVWAVVSDNRIRIWPPIFENSTLQIDGKISPPALSTLTNFPTIPYRYQESFIEYVIAMGLDRENDDRAAAKKQEAIQLIKLDIQDDMRESGNTEQPRIKHMREVAADGIGANLDVFRLFRGFRDYGC